MRRVLHSIRISQEVWEKARKLGLNISRICEKALIQEINLAARAESRNGGNLGGGAPSLVLRPGFEPGSAAREAAILDRTILPEP